jgi:hypothetical protein
MSMTSLHFGQRAFLPAALSGALIDAPHKGQMTFMAKPLGPGHHRLLSGTDATEKHLNAVSKSNGSVRRRMPATYLLVEFPCRPPRCCLHYRSDALIGRRRIAQPAALVTAGRFRARR